MFLSSGVERTEVDALGLVRILNPKHNAGKNLGSHIKFNGAVIEFQLFEKCGHAIILSLHVRLFDVQGLFAFKVNDFIVHASETPLLGFELTEAYAAGFASA